MVPITSTPTASAVQHPTGAFGGTFLVSFALVFLIAMAAQVLFLDWRVWLPGAEGEKSLIKGVRAGVYTFMSHLQ